jgi:DNA-binding response OmpR family regulator
MTILLLEDDFELANEVAKYLKSRNFNCDIVYDGSMVSRQLQVKPYDLVLLDINVPGMNGLEVCRHIRESNQHMPILMLTAYGEIDDKLLAFDHGADDYLVKPFHFDELFARINVLLRRREIPQSQKKLIQVHDLQIDLDEMTAMRNGNIITLTPKEFKLLGLLAEANGRVLSKQFLAEKLWDYHIETSQNTIEVYINFLRNKIDKHAEVKLIHTRIGFGYYLKQEA